MTIQQKIIELFLAKLAESDDVDAMKIKQLKDLFADKQRPKPDDLVKIFSLLPGGNLK